MTESEAILELVQLRFQTDSEEDKSKRDLLDNLFNEKLTELQASVFPEVSPDKIDQLLTEAIYLQLGKDADEKSEKQQDNGFLSKLVEHILNKLKG